MDIYVGNLSRNTTEESLRKFFEPYGAVTSAKVMTDKFTGEPRGFGFVAMPNNHEAEAAIAALNNRELDGRSLRINQARPQEPREGGFRPTGGFGGRSGGDRDRGGERGGGGFSRNNRF